MFTYCHRCSGELPSGDGIVLFCPHCASPQLYLPEDYQIQQQAVADSADSTGVLPPPLPRQVDWQAALRCAAIVAAIAAVLCVVALRVPGVSLLSTAWILTASTSTLALYHRRRPRAWMDAAVGARIGLVTGLTLIVLIAVSMALAGVISRFGLHAMVGFDADFAQAVVQLKEAAQHTSTPTPSEVIRLYDIPEFQAGIVLTSITLGSIILLAFSAFGGAIHGLLRQRRRAGI